MAKKGKKSRKTQNLSTQRANKSTYRKNIRLLRRLQNKKPFETILPFDRREFRPLYDDTIYQRDGNPAQIRVEGPNRRRIATKYEKNPSAWPRSRPTILAPNKTPVCIRRKRRRISLFASNKIGKGKSGPKTRKMSPTSKVKC